MKDNRSPWEEAKKKAGVDPDLHFHDLRRTFRSHMKMAGVDSFTLNEIDGHANPKIEKVYTQLTDEHLKAAIGRVPKWQAIARSHKTATAEGDNKNGVTG